jgi:WD repeat-containing protein 1 (actin-interacting protein 1)
LWQGAHLLSVSLSGFINYLDVNDPKKPLRIIKGHNKPITVLGLSEDRSTIYTGSHDGVVTNWNSGNGTNNRVAGTGHGNQINAIRAVGDFVYTCGIDDSVKQINIEANQYTGVEIALSSQPRGMDVLKTENIIIVGCVKDIMVIQVSVTIIFTVFNCIKHRCTCSG